MDSTHGTIGSDGSDLRFKQLPESAIIVKKCYNLHTKNSPYLLANNTLTSTPNYITTSTPSPSQFQPPA
jgi:hypothetical protein